MLRKFFQSIYQRCQKYSILPAIRLFTEIFKQLMTVKFLSGGDNEPDEKIKKMLDLIEEDLNNDGTLRSKTLRQNMIDYLRSYVNEAKV